MDKKPRAKAKPKFKVVKKDEKKKFKTAKPKKEEKKKMDKPKFKVVKKDEKKKFTTKKTAGEKLTGIKKADMKKMDPAALFGKLPKELRQKVLNPKETGVKVGSQIKKLEDFVLGGSGLQLDYKNLKGLQDHMKSNNIHYRLLYSMILSEPFEFPNKKLKSFKPEFTKRWFKKYAKLDDRSDNLYDLAYKMKFDHKNFRDFLKDFKENYDEPYDDDDNIVDGVYQYWLDYQTDQMNKHFKNKDRGKSF